MPGIDRRTLLAAGLGLVLAGCARLADRLTGPTRAASPGATSTSREAPPSARGTPAATPDGTGPTGAPPSAGTPESEGPTGAGASPDPGAPTAPAETGAGTGSGAVVVPVICRDAWGAQPAGGGLGRHRVRRLMVHHDAVELADDRGAPARLRSHQRYHLEQGWGDIAYHVAVDRRGHVYELRAPDAPGDTSTDYDPRGWYLVVALGNFDRQDPTGAQLEGLARVLAAAADRFGADPSAVAAHRDHASTSCPGDGLYRRMDQLRARAAALAGRVRTERLCGGPGRRRVAAIEAGRT